MAWYQLRKYIIRTGKMEQFLSAWRERIVPAREQHGFQVLEAYVEQDKSNFYWILRWDSEVAIAEGENKFLSSPEYQALNKDLGEFITAMETSTLESVPVR